MMNLLEKAKIFSKALQDEFKDRLVAVVLFGSVARGTASQNSDIDLLIVLKDMSPGRYQRRVLLDNVLEKFEKNHPGTIINGHLKTPEEAQKISLLYLDFPAEAQLLYDTNDFFKKIIQNTADKIQKSGAIRKKWGRFWYWDLKPGAHYDETFEIL